MSQPQHKAVTVYEVGEVEDVAPNSNGQRNTASSETPTQIPRLLPATPPPKRGIIQPSGTSTCYVVVGVWIRLAKTQTNIWESRFKEPNLGSTLQVC